MFIIKLSNQVEETIYSWDNNFVNKVETERFLTPF